MLRKEAAGVMARLDAQWSKVSPPPAFRALLHWALIPLLLVLFWLEHQQILTSSTHLLVLTLWGFTVGRADLRPYVTSPHSRRQLMDACTLILACRVVGLWIGVYLVGTDDPQGLGKISISFAQMLLKLAELPLVALGEEFSKALWGLSILSLVPFPRRIGVPLASFAVAIVFGLLHVAGGWPLTSWIPLALVAVADFIFLLCFRSIAPLVLVHFFHDAVAIMAMWAREWVVVILQLSMLCLILGQIAATLVTSSRRGRPNP